MARKINRIVIHCAATKECQDVKTETVRQWHLDKGWSDIGYHYVIELDGSYGIGRDENTVGAHVKGINTNSIGICYIGGVDKEMNPLDTRTLEQKESLEILIKHLMLKYPDAELCGHNEFSSKACPSFNVKEEYKHLISQ
jgi:N-acetylmuramoyl-L-alanine amidase